MQLVLNKQPLTKCGFILGYYYYASFNNSHCVNMDFDNRFFDRNGTVFVFLPLLLFTTYMNLLTDKISTRTIHFTFSLLVCHIRYHSICMFCLVRITAIVDRNTGVCLLQVFDNCVVDTSRATHVFPFVPCVKKVWQKLSNKRDYICCSHSVTRMLPMTTFKAFILTLAFKILLKRDKNKQVLSHISVYTYIHVHNLIK